MCPFGILGRLKQKLFYVLSRQKQLCCMDSISSILTPSSTGQFDSKVKVAFSRGTESLGLFSCCLFLKRSGKAKISLLSTHLANQSNKGQKLGNQPITKSGQLLGLNSLFCGAQQTPFQTIWTRFNPALTSASLFLYPSFLIIFHFKLWLPLHYVKIRSSPRV